MIANRLLQRARILRHSWSNALDLVGWSRFSGPRTIVGASSRAARSTSADCTPVILCVWRRPERLRRTIDLLRSQIDANPVLYIWNNNPKARGFVDDTVIQITDLEIHTVHSTHNAGGFGRFYVARDLAPTHPFVIFIDDDQTFPETAIAQFVREFRPKTISGFWAFRFTGRSEYRLRVPATVPGERVDYAATCGVICDSEVFSNPDFFRCPRRFWFVEDLWLSYFADHVLGWQIFKSAVTLDADDDGLDQYHYLYRTKSRFLETLVNAGWALPRTSSAA